MNLAGFQINPVLRDKWEAVDLGIVLARRWYLPLFMSWLVASALVFWPLLVLFPEKSWIAGMMLWWLKPLFDRLPLFFLSRYIFSENLSLSDSRKEFFSALSFSLFSALTWRRFDLQRSFNLPVTVLERQKGKARSDRCNLLQRNCGSVPFWVTIVMVHLEMLLCFSFAAMAFLFIPQGVEIDFLDSYNSEPLLYEIVYYILYFLSAALIGPFYIACGFSLYINRRIELEAWDIEIAFRQSVYEREKRKEKHQVKKGASVLAFFLALSFFGLFNSQPLEASEQLELEQFDQVSVQRYEVLTGTAQERSRNEILNILQSPPFVIEEEKTVWSWKQLDRETTEEEVPYWLIWFVRLIENIFGVSGLLENIAFILEVIIWTLVVILIAVILYHFRSHIRLYWSSLVNQKGADAVFEKPETIMGMEITEESLPEDIPAEAKSLWSDGQIRQALALLYRGSLYELVYTHHLELAGWFTEQECCALVNKSADQDLAKYFVQLTTSWQNLAYAHRQPAKDHFEALCYGWREAFQHG